MKSTVKELLMERKKYYSDKCENLLLSEDYDHEELKDALHMFSAYIDVEFDMREFLTQN